MSKAIETLAHLDDKEPPVDKWAQQQKEDADKLNNWYSDVYRKAKNSTLAYISQNDFDEWDAIALLEEVEQLLSDIFLSSKWLDGSKFDDYKAFHWSHRAAFDLDDDLQFLGIDRTMLQNAVASYVKMPWLRTDFLDWICADKLTYAEIIAYIETQFIRSKGAFTSAALLQGTKRAKGLAKLWVVIRWFLKWGIWAVITFLLFAAHSIAGTIWLSLTAIKLVASFIEKRKQDKMLFQMTGVYSMLRTETFSWSVFMDTLQESRQVGVVWDGELYKLPETRMTNGSLSAYGK